MGKKEKAKSEKEIVRKDIKVKANNAKQTSYINLNILTVSLSVIAVALALGSYHVYTVVTHVPDLPKFDLNSWWGPNTTRDVQDKSVRRYRIVFSDAMIEQLNKFFDEYRRVTKHKKSLEDTAWTYGVNYEAFAQFFSHWLFKYSFRARVRFLNQFEHFKTNIQGLDIHFIHVKPKVKDNVKVVPLLLLHGWPGSIREFYEAIPLLTTERPGYDFVFEIIAPSLPGFAYSQASVKPGLNTLQIAIIMRNLMQRLGYSQYFVQGGDFGHSIGSHMSTIFPNEILGFHSTLPTNFSKFAFLTWIFGAICPTFFANGLADRMYPLKDKINFYLEESGYMHLQGTKPDTIGVALQDSPTGLAAYILDRFMIFTDPNNKLVPEGGLDKYYSTDSLIDNIMLYWTTKSITTSLRLYKESFMSSEVEQVLANIPTSVPTWGLRTKHELLQQPDFILRWKFSNLIGTTTLDSGGHFAAFEKPKEFTDDVFKAVKGFLEFHERK